MTKADTADSWLPRAFEPGLVSVVIPTFNRAGLVCETVRSVFRQTLRPLEVIVWDDGSTDDSVARLRELQAPAGIAFEVVAGTNRGACPSRNDGAARSQGEFLMFLDSDDLLTAIALEKLAARLAEGAAEMAFGPWREMRTRDDRCTLGKPVTRAFGDDWFADLLRNQWIATCAVLYRRAVLHRIAGWREDTVKDGDFHFNAQLGAAGATVAAIPELTSYYRIHTGVQLSTGNFAEKARHTQRVLLAAEQAMNERGTWTDARRVALAWRYFYTARSVWRLSGDREFFTELVREACRIDPDFRPPNAWYARIASVLGYRNAERFADLRRRLFR